MLGDVNKMETNFMGRYVVTDPEICHGKPTFRGTRILVADVLEQVADGLAWETIVEEWRGSISYEAIAEAVRLSRQAFLENVDKYALGPMAT
jgi:uncharacterized protein (DUF433 family)